jgi:hypothetical protein
MLISWMPSLTKGAKRRPMKIYRVYIMLNNENAFDNLMLSNNQIANPKAQRRLKFKKRAATNKIAKLLKIKAMKIPKSLHLFSNL